MEKLEASYIADENVKWCSHFQKYVAVPQKVKHKATIWPRNSTPIPKRIEDVCLHKNLYVNGHSNIIHKSPKGETTQIFISWWMVWQNVVYLYNGILFSHKSKWGTDICYNLDKPQKHGKWKKADTKGLGSVLGLYDSIYVKYLE